VAGDFGTLAGLASPCPGATILLHAWPHEALCDQSCCLMPSCLSETNHGRAGRLGAVRGLGLTAEASRQTCRSKWKLRRREFAASRPVLPCQTPAVLEARLLFPAMRLVRRGTEPRCKIV
jgi:hypothetical protein